MPASTNGMEIAKIIIAAAIPKTIAINGATKILKSKVAFRESEKISIAPEARLALAGAFARRFFLFFPAAMCNKTLFQNKNLSLQGKSAPKAIFIH
jgi:hypothetical protein